MKIPFENVRKWMSEYDQWALTSAYTQDPPPPILREQYVAERAAEYGASQMRSKCMSEMRRLQSSGSYFTSSSALDAAIDAIDRLPLTGESK